MAISLEQINDITNCAYANSQLWAKFRQDVKYALENYQDYEALKGYLNYLLMVSYANMPDMPIIIDDAKRNQARQARRRMYNRKKAQGGSPPELPAPAPLVALAPPSTPRDE